MRVGALLLATCFAFLKLDGSPSTAADGPNPIVSYSDSLYTLIDEDAKLELSGSGFEWAEGPVWSFEENCLYFSDIPRNRVYQLKEDGTLEIALEPSGFTQGMPVGPEPGSNGLLIDPQGALYLAQHGDRRIAKLPSPDSSEFETLASHHEGKRFNSPNDLCLDSSGNLYFTDPSYGLWPKQDREIGFNGIYRVTPEGTVTLLDASVSNPNGISLSLDENTLYVSDSSYKSSRIYAFTLTSGGLVGEKRTLFDSSFLNDQGFRGSNDGLKVDEFGNVWASAPGGVIIVTTEGELLGHIKTGRLTSNCAFGGVDGKTLYITADDSVFSVRTKTQAASRIRSIRSASD